MKGLIGLHVVQSVVNTVTGQIDAAMKRMDTMTNFQRTMTAITGSSDMAAASLNQLKDITTGTAYGLDVAAMAVQNFTTRGMGIGNATSEVGKWADAVAFYGDIAERDTINRFTTAEISIVQTNNNKIASDMDLDGVVEGLTSAVDEAISNATEGVH